MALATVGETATSTPTVAIVAVPTRAIPDCTEPLMLVYDVAVVAIEPTIATPVSDDTAVDPLSAIAPTGELLAHLPLDDGPGSDETVILSEQELEAQLRGDFEWQPAGSPVAGEQAPAFSEDGAILEITNPSEEGYLRRPSPGRLVAMWIRPDDLSPSQLLYSEGDETNGLRVFLSDGQLVARVAGTLDAGAVENEAAVALDFQAEEWHHVAVDYNYDALSLYLDGELLAVRRGSPVALAGGEDDVASIGGIAQSDEDVIGDPYRGQLADVRIYNSPVVPDTTTPTAVAVQPTATALAATSTPAPATPEATSTPPATPTAAATAPAAAPVIAGTPPPFGIRNLPLFELPFPYNGGNSRFGGTADQFFQAIQGAYNGGRVTSYYDHQYPLYPPAFNGLEPVEHDGRMVTWAGTILDTVYSGHPGFDMSPTEPNRSTTPLFAAADGVIRTAAIHAASGGYYVEILHSVRGVGDFLSRYWHLEPDEYFDETRRMVGEFVPAGTRIGTIGNTGWSTGHHLHFEVRYDENGDGRFGRNETVDPFGFIPLSPFAPDPWEEGVNIVRNDQTSFVAGPASPYLWRFQLGTTAQMPTTGGGKLMIQPLAVGGEGGEGGSTLCIPEGSAPPGAVVNFSLIPDPPPSRTLAGTGNGCALSAFTSDGEPITAFDPPIAIYVPFEPGDLANIERPQETLGIYWFDPDTGQYEPRPTVLDFELGLAYSTLDRPGHCALLGLPNRDLVAPVTAIHVDGPVVDGVYSGQVSVQLTAADAQGEVEMTTYSLDNGETWRPYEGAFSVPAEELLVWPPPSADASEAEEGLIQGPGRYLVLAASQDDAGNLEVPPAFKVIVIDPRLQPVTPSATPTPTRCAPPAGWVRYIIRSRDTVSRLSALTNTLIPRLLAANCRQPDDTILSIGEVFFLPQSLETATPVVTSTAPGATPTLSPLVQTAVSQGSPAPTTAITPTATPFLPTITPPPTPYVPPPPPPITPYP